MTRGPDSARSDTQTSYPLTMTSSGSANPGQTAIGAMFGWYQAAARVVSLKTWMRRLLRSATKMRPSGPTASECTTLNSPRPSPASPNSVR